jgi:hypothetical protein
MIVREQGENLANTTLWKLLQWSTKYRGFFFSFVGKLKVKLYVEVTLHGKKNCKGYNAKMIEPRYVILRFLCINLLLVFMSKPKRWYGSTNQCDQNRAWQTLPIHSRVWEREGGYLFGARWEVTRVVDIYSLWGGDRENFAATVIQLELVLCPSGSQSSAAVAGFLAGCATNILRPRKKKSPP